MNAVSDSAFFIGLERIGRSELIPRIFDSISVPPAVEAEVGSLPDCVSVVQPKNSVLVSALKTQIDDGEAEAIALAMERQGSVLVLDDRKARKIALRMGLKVLGTVGVLVQAKSDGIIREVRSILDGLIEVGFRISDELYEEALALADEALS